MKKLASALQEPNFDKKLAVSLKNPNGKEAKEMLKIMIPLLRIHRKTNS